MLHQLGEGDFRIVNLGASAVDDLAEIVRRHVGGHADGDAGAAVDEQVGKGGGEHDRLGEALVVIGDKVDGILVHVLHEGAAQVGEPGLGVTHGGGRVAFDGAEIALGVHESLAHGPGLGHMHQGRVDHGLAVGMVIARGVAADLGALHVFPGWIEPQLVHRIEDAALRGFEAVPHVGQGARDDDGHRVIQKRVLDLVGHVDFGDDLVGGERRRAAERPLVALTRFGHKRSYTSRFLTLSALSSMNWRRGSTSSPISLVNISSASTAFNAVRSNAQEFSARGIHGGLEEFFGVHFAEALEPLDLQAPAAHLFDAREDFRDGKERFDLLFVPLAFEQLEERLVLGRVMLDLEALVRQFLEQLPDGMAFVEFLVPRAAGRAIPGLFHRWGVVFLLAGKAEVQVGIRGIEAGQVFVGAEIADGLFVAGADFYEVLREFLGGGVAMLEVSGEVSPFAPDAVGELVQLLEQAEDLAEVSWESSMLSRRLRRRTSSVPS